MSKVCELVGTGKRAQKTKHLFGRFEQYVLGDQAG